MDGLVKEYLVSFYTRNLVLHGDRPEALRWSPEGQRLRYGVMLDALPDIGGRKVLDYGCGKGDLYGFIRERGLDVSYTGIDINPELIDLAAKKHPGARFMVSDVEDTPLEEDYDIVFLCGVFNNKVEGVGESMRNVLSALFERTTEALAVNGLSSHAKDKAVELNYTSPEELSSFVGANLTPRFELIQGYLPGDFTLVLNKKRP
ncbi:MAG: class I SAM-dependent methyltransferase [Nitrospirota bacterium]|jgi:SAM-dependent methyltransferase